MVLVNLQVIGGPEQRLHKLIDGHDIVKAAQGDGVLHTRIVGVKGQDIIHAHIDQLLEHKSTIHGLAGTSSMLPALIEEGQDDSDGRRLAGGGANQSLDIRIDIIGRHVIHVAADLVLEAVVQDVRNDIEINSTDRFCDKSFRFSGTKPGTAGFDQVRISTVILKNNITDVVMISVFSPINDIRINTFSQGLAARVYDDAKTADWDGGILTVIWFHRFDLLFNMTC